ncbi:MAG: hypothetical protein P1U67_10540 [Alcanivoracaceae bacterium]|nr:hypothetical protein [Alcanivoracaceae bacterium]
MSRDKEVNLGAIDDVTVDDARARRPAEAGKPRKSEPRADASKPSSKVSPASKSTASSASLSGTWLYAAAVFVVLVVLLSAYLFREIQEMRAILASTQDQSSQQLGNLASQLSATDESLNQSSGKISDDLKLHESEIRKLWDVSNKRNKEWIEKNQADISKIEKQRAEISKSVSAMEAEITALKKQSQQYALQRNQMQTQIDLASEAMKQAEAKVAAQKKVIDQVNQMMPSLKSLAAVQAKGDGLDVRIGEVEAAISAFDAYRRQVNIRLDRVESAPR